MPRHMESIGRIEISQPTANIKQCGKVQKPKILIVDDEESLLLSLSDVLSISFSNFDILTAPSAEIAIEILEGQEADLVITDLKLPQMNGLQLMRHLHQESPQLPTILMTAYGSEHIKNIAYDTGCLAYLQKPFDLDVLIKFIDQGLRKRNVAQYHQKTEPIKSINSKQTLSPLMSSTNVMLSSKETALKPGTKKTSNPLTSQTIDNDEPIYLNLNDCYIKSEKKPQNQPLEQNIKDLVNKGIAYFKNCRLQEAKTTWEKALELNPNCNEAKHNLAILEAVIHLKTNTPQ